MRLTLANDLARGQRFFKGVGASSCYFRALCRDHLELRVVRQVDQTRVRNRRPIQIQHLEAAHSAEMLKATIGYSCPGQTQASELVERREMSQPSVSDG